MNNANFTMILEELGYASAINAWEKLDKITRFNLTTNGSLYNEMGNEKAEYYFDSAYDLLYKRLVNSQNKVIKYCVAVDIKEIISIELLTPYSESVFNGNSLLR